MSNDRPGGGLFPESYNVDVYGNSTSEDNDLNTDDITEQSHKKSNETDSVDSSILAEILEEQYKADSVRFRESLNSNKFFISQLYDIKTGRHSDEGEKNDFMKYNRRLELEYKLREKAERLLVDSSAKNELSIMNSSILNANYIGGEELQVPNTKYHLISGLVSKITRPTKAKELEHHGGIPLQIINTSSGDTQIIDTENNGDWTIDHDYAPKTKTQKLESWISISRYSNNAARKTHRGPKLLKKVNALKNSNHSVQRKLEARHIQMIASGSSLGVGLFLTSGKAFTIAGPFGALLGYILCGSIVMATTISFTELCALIPLTSGFSGLASRFVEDAFGFALGWLYWFSFIIALPSQIVASSTLLHYYQGLNISSGKMAGFVTLFLSFAVLLNLCDVRAFGNFVYFATTLKICFTILMIFVMIVLNSGGSSLGYDRVGFRFWDSSKSEPFLNYGLFRPTFDLKDVGEGSVNGIGGARGRLLAVFLSMLIAAFTYSGLEMTFVASCEVRNPKRTLPSAMKRTNYTMLLLYILAIFIISLNVYSGDPRLPRFYSYSDNNTQYNINHNIGTTWQLKKECASNSKPTSSTIDDGNRSAWVIALRSFGRCTFGSVLNGILIFFGTTSGCSSLYGASHTLYSMAIQEKAPSIFKTCTSYGVPWIAVLFSGLFGVISYMAVDQSSLNNFQILANIASATICIIWAGMNVSFLRFFYALKIRPDIISRDDPMFPYKSPFQPYLSYYGLFGSIVMVVFSGFTSFFHGFWNVKIFFSCYGGLIFFIVSYVGYKIFGTSKLQRLDQVDMDVGRIEMDRSIWNAKTDYKGNWKERFSKLVTWFY